MTTQPVWTIAWLCAVLRVNCALSLFVLLLTTQNFTPAQTKSNHGYAVSELCRNHFLQQLHRVVDGATVYSRNERNLHCQLTFQTESILQRFMLRFDYLQLDCNDHLYIHDGAHAIDGKYKAELSCRNTHQSVGTLYMRSNYVTLEYKTDSWGTDKNGFNVVITAFRRINPALAGDCQGIQCGQHCVSADLACDNIKHCANAEDESISAGCSVGSLETMLGTDRTVVIVVAVGISVVCVVLVAALVVCVSRRRQLRAQQNQQHQQMNARPLANGNLINNTSSTMQMSVGYTDDPRAMNGHLPADKLLHSENWKCPTEWTGSPALNLISQSKSPLQAQMTWTTRKMSGSCSGRSLRGGAWFADPGRRAHCCRQLLSPLAAALLASAIDKFRCSRLNESVAEAIVDICCCFFACVSCV